MNLANDPGVVEAMVAAGFAAVFLGIETTSTEALAEAGKRHNLRIDPQLAVERLTDAGLEVMGGFIVGFDQDGPETFDSQQRFIGPAPIPLAMVGLLNALPGTALSKRLQSEGRLRDASCGDQFGRPNFDPAMDEEQLLAGYGRLLADLYSPEAYYRRCEAYVERAASTPGRKRATWNNLFTFAKAVVKIGVLSRWRWHFWRLVGRAFTRSRHNFAWAVGHAVMGEHMIRYTREHVLPRIEAAIAELRAKVPASLPRQLPALAPARADDPAQYCNG
jgi:radical SAM superfamily enzyme YgiQ (UPF0313 family)